MQGVELQLKHVHAVGVYGWGSVCESIIGEWLEDISQNQVLFYSVLLANVSFGFLSNSMYSYLHLPYQQCRFINYCTVFLPLNH